jgi:UDP-MurNAc hydroxylase
MTISFRFLNHASFLIVADSVRLVTDPWFESDVFNSGWSLLHEDKNTNLPALRPTDIWLSHEHPDHFNIATLSRIPLEMRSQITVHIRQTKDDRVRSWCRKSGFNVEKNVDGTATILGSETKLTIYPVGIEDSAALIEIGGIKVLNLNDCLFFSEKSLRKFAEKIGNVDYVTYICGYAEGGGTKTDTTFRENLFQLHMRRFKQMKEAFPNAQIVGFAAFKHFSHIENQFQNDQVSFRYIRELIVDDPNTFRLVAPGDELTDVSASQSLAACDFWEDKLKFARPVTTSAISVDRQTLIANSQNLVDQLKSNGRAWLYLASGLPNRLGLDPLEFHIFDHKAILKLSLIGKSVTWTMVDQSTQLEGKIRVTSAALEHAVSHDFGLSTLMVNGRFEANDRTRRQLHRWAVLSLLNAAGEKLGLRYLLANAARVARNI